MTAGQAPILNTEPCNQLSIGEVADALNFTVLGDLLDATKLYNALNGTRYVLLAPTDMAFSNALKATGLTVEKLLSRPDLVSQILTYHVVNSTNAPAFFANRVRCLASMTAPLHLNTSTDRQRQRDHPGRPRLFQLQPDPVLQRPQRDRPRR